MEQAQKDEGTFEIKWSFTSKFDQNAQIALAYFHLRIWKFWIDFHEKRVFHMASIRLNHSHLDARQAGLYFLLSFSSLACYIYV